MRKTYITTMPNQIGAFLKASRCLAELGVNITRVSYNKAIDSHTLFIDAEGTAEQLQKAGRALTEIGYLQPNRGDKGVVLLEFMLPDVPGGATDILSLINEFDFNISYLSSQENGTDCQYFKMGLYVEDRRKISDFLVSARKLCQVRMVDYDRTEKVYDNSIFYQSFVDGLVRSAGLGERQREELLINTNLAMQTLDDRGLSPYRTFDSIGRFAELLAAGRGDDFCPRITRHTLSEQTELILIEPPCGSNTAILRCGTETLFVDCGYACYRREMEKIFRQLLPDYDTMEKTILITHADVDHCGLLGQFDTVITSKKSAGCLLAEYEHRDGFREQNCLHKPYINICKILTEYEPVDPKKIRGLWGSEAPASVPLMQTGLFSFGDLNFEVYEGQGGHLPGEVILLDYEHKVAFTGDVYVNLKDMIPAQAAYNQYAPILMTSVDTDPEICARERRAVLQRLGSGKWQIFGGHGGKKEYAVTQQK